MEALEVEHLRGLRLRLAGCSHPMEGGIEIFQIWWQLGLGIWVFSVHVRFSSDAIWDCLIEMNTVAW